MLQPKQANYIQTLNIPKESENDAKLLHILISENKKYMQLFCQFLDLVLSKFNDEGTTTLLCVTSWNWRAMVYKFELTKIRTEYYRTDFALEHAELRIRYHQT